MGSTKQMLLPILGLGIGLAAPYLLPALGIGGGAAAAGAGAGAAGATGGAAAGLPAAAGGFAGAGATAGLGGGLAPAGMGAGLGALAGKAALPAALVGSQMYQGQQAKKAAESAAEGAKQTWKQTAFPSPAAVGAAGTETRGALGQARLGSYQNLASQLAARGFGSGSGLGVQGAADIEKGYLQSLGKMSTDLTKFQHTPMFGQPGAMYQQPVSGAVSSGLSGMDAALGLYMASQLFK